MKFATLVFVSLVLFWQDPHNGQPATCDNYHKTPEKEKCKCWHATSCKRQETEDPKCRVYCRKDACKCLGPCTS